MGLFAETIIMVGKMDDIEKINVVWNQDEKDGFYERLALLKIITGKTYAEMGCKSIGGHLKYTRNRGSTPKAYTLYRMCMINGVSPNYLLCVSHRKDMERINNNSDPLTKKDFIEMLYLRISTAIKESGASWCTICAAIGMEANRLSEAKLNVDMTSARLVRICACIGANPAYILGLDDKKKLEYREEFLSSLFPNGHPMKNARQKSFERRKKAAIINRHTRVVSQFGRRVADLMRGIGISHRELSKKCGFALNVVRGITSGKNHDMRALNLQTLANYFGVSMDYLFGNDDVPNRRARSNQVEHVEVGDIANNDNVTIEGNTVTFHETKPFVGTAWDSGSIKIIYK